MVVMTSVTVVVATPVKTDLRSDGGGDERWGHENKTLRALYQSRHSLKSHSDSDPSLTSLISAVFVSLTYCYDLCWIWH
ncbi:hypothetical protein F2Q68_00006300 [Brassica cretica]|uniref:Uncharacterized protein n=1 Tax=Brassica cretica TaxID=69181 RepID=A0A8S9JDS0_BRACR|nr:hypothetical protein F2Q68_00006300 [Brassica cretica]